MAENIREEASTRSAQGARTFEIAEMPRGAPPPGRVVHTSRDVKKLLQGIGTPPQRPFKPDPFQLEALAMLEYEDVLVTAPLAAAKRGSRAKKFGAC